MLDFLLSAFRSLRLRGVNRSVFVSLASSPLLLGRISNRCDFNLPVDHPVLLEWPIVLSSIFKREHAVAMLEVLVPVTLVLASVGVIERSFAMTEASFPVTDIPVPEELVVTI